MNSGKKTRILGSILFVLIGGLTVMVGTPANSSDFSSPSNPDISLSEDAAVSYFGQGANTTNSEIERVKESYEQSLLEIDGVTGVGIGKNASGNDVIVVYLYSADAQQKVPTEINGFTVRTEITGEIEAF